MYLNKQSRIAGISIYLGLLIVSCTNPQINNNLSNTSAINQQISNSISGRVDFPDFKIKATLNEIAPKATVSLLYPSDYSVVNLRNVSVATGLTNSNGQFTINTNSNFNPQTGQVYVLEAVKRLGGAGNNILTLRTHLKWNGDSYDSITSPDIFINTKTTALSIISSLGGISANDTIGSMIISNSIVQVNDIPNTTITANKINSVKALVEQSLSDNNDPVASIIINNNQYAIKETLASGETNFIGCVGEPDSCNAPIPTPDPSDTSGCIGEPETCSSSSPTPIPTSTNPSTEPSPTSSASPIGELKVNTYTNNVQYTPKVSYAPNGDFVITWASEGQDGSYKGIYAQRFNSAGIAQGSEFQVNTYISGPQERPSIAHASNGDFVVTWTSNAQDGDGYGIFAQRYNSTGIPQGSEFQVNTNGYNMQDESSVAYGTNGNFVITWQSYYQDGNNSYGIYAQRYSSTGVAQGSEFQVHTYTPNSQDTPSVAYGPNGDFIITWTSRGQDVIGDYDGSGIYAQRFNSSGVAQGSEFLVNTYLTGPQENSSVAYGSNGEFVITWHSYGQDGSHYGIFAQRFNSSGVAQGSEFLVNTYTNDLQKYPSVSYAPNGEFVITWTSSGQEGNYNYGIFAQRFNSSGVAQGSEFQVNSYTEDTQEEPSVAYGSNGDFVITWQSRWQDSNNYGVYAKKYNSLGIAQ